MKALFFAVTLVSLGASATNLVDVKSITLTPSLELRAYSENGPSSKQLTAYGSWTPTAHASCTLNAVSTNGLALKMTGKESKSTGVVYSYALTSNLVLTSTKSSSTVEQITMSCNGEPEICGDELYNQQTVTVEATDAKANRFILVCISNSTGLNQSVTPLKANDTNITGLLAD